MKNKILLYGDVNLNIIDGSSIWLTSLATLLAQDNNNEIDILLKTKITSSKIIDSLTKLPNVNLIEVNKYIKSCKQVNYTNIKKVIELIDDYRDYSCMIIRGFDVVKALLQSSIRNKMIPYITDFCHDENLMSEEEKKSLNNIYDTVKYMFVQTDEMKQYIGKIIKKKTNKIAVLSPMVFINDLSKVSIKQKSIVYVGKFAKEWNILELIEIMEKIYKQDKEIKLYVIGNKFNRDLLSEKNYILKKFSQMPNIEYIGSLSREDAIEFIQTCKIGYNFRSEVIDHDNSLELSTKMLEYCKCEKPVIVRETLMYKNLFGEDYQLYINSVDEAVTKIINIFSDKNLYEKSQKKCKNVGKKFSVEEIYNNIKPIIYSYEPKKLRLLISGHDLKFIDKLFPFFRKKYDLIIQQPDDYMYLNEKESKKLLKGSDIIWCEWMLMNAEWYSKHKLPHQKLYIRAHRFEIERKYGFKLNIENVDKIITVSYNYYEEFIDKFCLPRHKTTIISNYVETQDLNKTKKDNYKYNIALIGALPAKKGLDRAIDLLIKLRKVNKKYNLIVAGKKPEDSPFWNLKDERMYYENVYKKIKENNLENFVKFTGWIAIPKFLREIGYTLSLTDPKNSESFHLAPMETIASGGVGLILRWEGSEYIYPEYMIFNSLDEIATRIEELNNDTKLFNIIVKDGKNFVAENYDINRIWQVIDKLLQN